MSSVIDPRSPSSRRGSRATTHWLWIIVVSIVIHLLLLDALPHFVVEPVADKPALEPLQARLMPAIEPEKSTPIPPPPDPTPRPRPRPPPRSVPLPPPRSIAPKPETVVPESFEPVPEVNTLPLGPSTPMAGADTSTTSGATAAPVPVPAQAATPSSAAPPPAPTVTPPLSARLEYKALSQNVKEANPIYGNGTITWSTSDGHYAIGLDVSAKAVFFDLDLLASRSEGSVGASGLVPDRYTEKTRRRSMLATNFNRDARQSVTFSASAVSVPLPAGAQDRLSILFQIGGLLLADPAKAVAGTRIEVPVANVRDEVERWVFTCFGNESIETGVGTLATTHLQRTPKPGSNDKTIDLWVADGGYPARVLYTEPSGNTIMMTLDRIGAVK